MAANRIALANLLRMRPGGTPVFLYHGLDARPGKEVPVRERKYRVPAKRFRGHLNQIRSDGYRVIPLREFWNSTGTLSDGKQPVVLTFDDGRASDYGVAYPLLLEAGVRADFFVNTATVGRPGYLTWLEIATMHRSGMSFQSHGQDHVDLSRIPARELERQLKDSKRLLEDRLGCSVDFLAVPYGELNDRVLDVALQMGYRAICGSRSWPARPGAPIVNRLVIYAHTTPRDFHRLLVRNPACYGMRAARAMLFYLPKRVFLSFRPHPLRLDAREQQA